MTWLDIGKLALTAVIAYLIGSFSPGILIGKKKGHDIRSEGSKNTGATNVLRTVGLQEGLITFLCDFAKAALAIFIGRWIAGYVGGLGAGLFAVIGHNWPVYYGFKGGKGISCSTAVVLCTFFWQGAVACAVCVLFIAATKYVSVGSLSLVSTFAVLVFLTVGIPEGLWALAIAAMAFYRHRTNLVRLKNGTENKLSFHKKKTE